MQVHTLKFNCDMNDKIIAKQMLDVWVVKSF